MRALFSSADTASLPLVPQPHIIRTTAPPSVGRVVPLTAGRGYPPPHPPPISAPAADKIPAEARARSDTSVSARPSFANRREARLVRSDQTERTSAPIVASAHAATIESASGPQWCAQRNEAYRSAAES